VSFEERRTDAGTENTVSAWIALLAAGLLEIAWALGLKYSDGLTRLWPTVATLVAIALSFGLMALALRSLPFGTAYAVWTGIGAAGSIIVGIILYSEPADSHTHPLPDFDCRRDDRAETQFARLNCRGDIL
jgi:quaternary ammonium compound-resistance protein SugE